MTLYSIVTKHTGRIRRQVSHYVESIDPEKRFEIMTMISFVPAFLVLFLIGILPLVYIMYLSFHEMRLVTVGQFIGLKNYATLFSNPEFLNSIWRSLVFGVGNVTFQVGAGLVFALALEKQLIGRGMSRLVSPVHSVWGTRIGNAVSGVFRSLIILPYLVPVIAMVFMWEWTLNAQYGILPKLAVNLGLTAEPIYVLGLKSTAMGALIITNSWKFTAFAVILFLARLRSINDRLYQAAQIAGASELQMFRDITIPHLKSTILLVGLLRFIWMFNKFDSIWLFTRGGPASATTTLPIRIFEISFDRYNMGAGSAAAMVLFLLLASFGVIYFYFFNPSDEIEPMR